MFMLTTVDNPYDPSTQYDEWMAWDEAAGYMTNGLLARFVVSSEQLSEADQEQAIQDAIDEIIELNPMGVHRKVPITEIVQG